MGSEKTPQRSHTDNKMQKQELQYLRTSLLKLHLQIKNALQLRQRAASAIIITILIIHYYSCLTRREVK